MEFDNLPGAFEVVLKSGNSEVVTLSESVASTNEVVDASSGFCNEVVLFFELRLKSVQCFSRGKVTGAGNFLVVTDLKLS